MTPRPAQRGWGHDDVHDTVEVAVRFPVSAPVTPDGDVTPFELPGGRVVTGIHVGTYDSLEATYRELTAWADGRAS